VRASTVQATIATVSRLRAADYLLSGDFKQFVIVDRVGTSIEVIPHLFGGQSLPHRTARPPRSMEVGQRRVGRQRVSLRGDVVVSTAKRATTLFSCVVEDTEYIVHEGEPYADDHPVVAAHPELFGVGVVIQGPVEEATPAPSEIASDE
jgi:hypothetical protein